MRGWYGLALVGRLLMMTYGAWLDTTMSVKYTDVDYFVFSDAAHFVTQGQSPYLRSTFRYPPVLAWLLTPNIWFHSMWGKILFIIADILTSHLIYTMLRRQGHSKKTCRNCSLVWLLNPVTATVSSRGNAESIMAFLVLMSISFLLEGKTVLSALFYAMSIHFKIYPITFAIPIYLYLGDEGKTSLIDKAQKNDAFSFRTLMHRLFPNKARCLFISVAALFLGSMTLICYYMYGWVFLYETYLYHIVRGDIRHNFSPYFYLLYLTSDPVTGVPLCLRLLVFLPQAVLLIAIAFKYDKDPPLAWFLSTFCFVMANKVCTSQYFLWYLSLLPLILPCLQMSVKKAVWLITLWFLAQGVWLLPAYLLEFEGHNTFLYIWLAGLVFFSVNGVIIYHIIDSYQPRHFKVR